MENLSQPCREVEHSTLRAVGEDIHRVECPFCDDGVLTVRRHPRTYRLSRNDTCLSCGQRVFYLDRVIADETLPVITHRPRQPPPSTLKTLWDHLD